MTQYLIMCRSLTYAQRAQKILERAGFSSGIVKAPQGLNTSGCGYAVSIYRRADEAISLLKANKLLSGKVFRRAENGDYVEVRL